MAIEPAINIDESLNQGLEPLAQLLKASGDPLRLEILRALSGNAFGVLELCQIFDAKQSGMSHHLKVLANAGLVVTRREGNTIYYRRAQVAVASAWQGLLDQLWQLVDEYPLSDAVLDRMQQVQAQRAAASDAFFTENADKFRQQQDLIASFAQYGDSVKELLLSVLPEQTKVVIEIGPGEGECLHTLSPLFNKVIAVDTSEDMLNKAKVYCQQQGLSNVDFVHGDVSKVKKAKANKANAVVCNMVLHHVPSPADLFQQVAERLEPQGVFVVCDLYRHDQQWARESCGDLWLGFEEEELNHWAEQVGLQAGPTLYLSLRNGFRVYLQAFIND